MPDLTSQASTFRGGKYNFTGYVAVIPQTIVYEATVNTTPPFPALSLTVTGTDGDVADVLRGMTVRVETSSGTFKGLLRVASGGTLNATTIPINEISTGTVNVAATDVIKIVAEYRIWDKLVSATAALNKDSRITYSDQGSNPPPVANAGGVYAGYVDDSNIITVDFDASGSFWVDPDSSGLSYSWDFGDGTPSSASTQTVSGVTFPPGFRYVSLTVTDNTNSKTTTKQVPVWAFDDDVLTPAEVIIDSLRGDVQTGWSATFRLPKASDNTLATLPDGALIVYFEDERYDGVKVSYGSNVGDRSHVKFVGYLLRDTITITPADDTVSFEAVGPLGILERTPALPQLLINDSTPTKWSEMKRLSIGRTLWYLYEWGSTIGTLFDTLDFTIGDLDYTRLAVTEISSVAGQLRDVATATNLLVTCDRLGRIQFVREFDQLNTSDRSSRTQTYAFTDDDILQISIPREHRGTTKFVRGEGITVSNKAVYSNGPGNAPSPIGAAQETFSRQVVSSQSDLNTRTGLRFAKVNGLFNGQFVARGVSLDLPNGYDWLEPAYNEPVTLTLADTTNSRAVSFSTDTRWTVRSVDISYEPGLKTIRAQIDHETTGPAGRTFIQPQSPASGLPSFPSFELEFPLPTWYIGSGFVAPTGGGLRSGQQTVGVWQGEKIYITTDFETPEAAGGPSWVEQFSYVSSSFGGYRDFTIDPFSPAYLGTGTEVNGWLMTSARIGRITDIFGSPAVSWQHTFGVSGGIGSGNGRIIAERGTQNWVVCARHLGSSGTRVAYTTDGSTWTDVTVSTNYWTGSASIGTSLWVSSRTPGLCYTSAYVNTTSSYTAAIARRYISTDYGASWAVASIPLSTIQLLHSAIEIPYGNTSENVVFWSDHEDYGGFFGTSPELVRNGAGTDVNISPTIAGKVYGPIRSVSGASARPLALADNNPNVLILCGTGLVGGTSYAVFITRNAFSGSPEWTVLAGPDASNVYVSVYSGAEDAFYLLGGAGRIGFCNGVTIDSRTGNLPTSSAVLSLFGG